MRGRPGRVRTSSEKRAVVRRKEARLRLRMNSALGKAANSNTVITSTITRQGEDRSMGIVQMIGW